MEPKLYITRMRHIRRHLEHALHDMQAIEREAVGDNAISVDSYEWMVRTDTAIFEAKMETFDVIASLFHDRDAIHTVVLSAVGDNEEGK